jgi:uncharacterized RDD family membrane protein YckC
LAPGPPRAYIRRDVSLRRDSSSASRARERYADPDERYLARFASPWRRAAAAAIDWTLCYVLFLLVSIPFGMLQTLGTVSREAGDLGGGPGHVLQVVAQALIAVAVVAYWAILLPTSQTYGMRITDIRQVSMRTGRGPSYVAAAVRGAIATVMAAAFYAVFLNATAFDKPQLDSTSQRLLDISYVLVVMGCVSALTMLVTPTGRSIFDRIFGTAVLDELEAPAPRLGPWGPLDAFDTSNRGIGQL